MATTTHSRWRIITLCMGVAVIFWLLNALNKDYTTTVNYPVHFVLDDSKRTFTETPPSRIALEVTGGGWNLLRYLLHINVKSINLPVSKVIKRGHLSRERVYVVLKKHLKDLKVNQVMTDTLQLHLQKKTN